MRKTIINPDTINPRPHSQGEWLDLGEIATVEVTSEDPNFPIEFALTAREGSGWRAAARGKQMIRIVLDRPRPVRRIRLEFSETESQRTQEFTLRWSQAGGLSPQGSTSELEDYQVQLEKVSALELTLKPDLTPDTAFATLAAWRVS